MISVMIAAMDNSAERVFIQSLYVKFYGIMKAKAYHIVHNMTDAEDIVQESFASLIKNSGTLMQVDKNKLPAYLICTVRNTAINYKKRREKESEYIIPSTDENSEEWVDGNSAPEDLFLRDEQLRSVAKSLLKLPERDRLVLEAKYILCLKDSDIAKKLNISKDSVRAYVSRARKKISLLMKEEFTNV